MPFDSESRFDHTWKIWTVRHRMLEGLTLLDPFRFRLDVNYLERGCGIDDTVL